MTRYEEYVIGNVAWISFDLSKTTVIIHLYSPNVVFMQSFISFEPASALLYTHSQALFIPNRHVCNLCTKAEEDNGGHGGSP